MGRFYTEINDQLRDMLDKLERETLVSASFLHHLQGYNMKVVNSLKTLKKRDRNCRVVRRKGRVYVINKMKPRCKARQG